MAKFLIWMRETVLDEEEWDYYSTEIAGAMHSFNEKYFAKVLSIVG